MKTGYKVSDVMTHVPIVVSSNSTLKDCAEKMEKKKVGTIIVEDDGKLLGIISERDIVRKVVAIGENPVEKKVVDVMVKELITIDPSEDIFDALNRMKSFDIRHLPVLHEGKLVGLLTMKDVLKIEPQLFEILVEKIKLREEARKPINKINDNEGICEFCGEYEEDMNLKDGSLVCNKCLKQIE
jgi:signal-transduction protein with cAMP-binding, CBS, and nucleotidyltransferase domain